MTGNVERPTNALLGEHFRVTGQRHNAAYVRFMTAGNVLSGAIILALFALILSSTLARAEGMQGVRETAKEVLVDVPKFCRPLKVVWEIRWEENAINKSAMISFLHADDPSKVKSLSSGLGVAKFQTIWSGAETVHIPKFDAKGKPIKIKRLSIAGMGDELGDFSMDNWIFILDGGVPKNVSPQVRVGTWGKCK